MEWDILRERIYVDCPKCNFWIRPFLKEVKEERVVVCPGCRANIHLIDNLYSVKKAQRTVRRAIRDLEDSFKDINITINL